ncbi:MFS transporter [Acinetobacter sp. MD2(2019)]|uniref:MFS transporter n=1 Tax=Acinetobacter sp. MD2(2019) TaxID=2605273 RepID=UPI002D1E9037|nr:MFS transporter [Acinetobacter sp. MD2(2019)]MEB3753839.1 MFS transporter [Acinetobacter sp. MD2(2019)]
MSTAPITPNSTEAITTNTPSPTDTLPANKQWIQQATPEYYRAGIALFLLGFASFSLIYCVQPLLPEFTHSFHVSPATSSLALSLTTGCLAFSIVLASAFSQAVGRKGLMFASMLLASLLNIAAALVTHWHTFLLLRALEGFILGGVPAVAMAWLAEEIDPLHLGKAMGLYIAGTAFGAMMGRVFMGLVTEFSSWQVALGSLSVICFIFAFGFLWLLPASRHFVKKSGFNLSFHVDMWKTHLQNTSLLRLYVIGFLLTSIFVTLFNYSTFYLSSAPYNLSQSVISLIFLVYAFGVVSSSIAGGLSDRLGKRPLMVSGFIFMLLGILLTQFNSIWIILFGVILVTTGFFITHSVTSSAIGPTAKIAKGHASSLYLLFYYLGSSMMGSFGGWFWLHGGWNAIIMLTGFLAILGAVFSLFSTRSSS